jgi:hypothetical protein
VPHSVRFLLILSQHQILYELVIQAISEHYPELHYDKLPRVYPEYVSSLPSYNSSLLLALEQLEGGGLEEPEAKPEIEPHRCLTVNLDSLEKCYSL